MEQIPIPTYVSKKSYVRLFGCNLMIPYVHIIFHHFFLPAEVFGGVGCDIHS